MGKSCTPLLWIKWITLWIHRKFKLTSVFFIVYNLSKTCWQLIFETIPTVLRIKRAFVELALSGFSWIDIGFNRCYSQVVGPKYLRYLKRKGMFGKCKEK